MGHSDSDRFTQTKFQNCISLFLGKKTTRIQKKEGFIQTQVLPFLIGAPAILVQVWVVLWHPKGHQNRLFSKWQVVGIFSTSNFGTHLGVSEPKGVLEMNKVGTQTPLVVPRDFDAILGLLSVGTIRAML